MSSRCGPETCPHATALHACPTSGAPHEGAEVGALTLPQDAINFAVFSSAATSVSLCLFTEGDLHKGRVTHELALDAELNRSGDVWHILLPALDASLLYGARFPPLLTRIMHAMAGST